MQIGILGSVEVTSDGTEVPLGGGRKRALLALLALQPGQTVPVDRIIDALWDEHPPATAVKVVQNLVAQLRHDLGDRAALETRGHGYALVVDGDAIDAVRFEQLLDDGRAQLDEGHPSDAVAQLRRALALWRGPALDGFAGEAWARADAARLEEERTTAFEQLVDAELALGHHADVLGELEAAVAREPLREGLRARLMLALYRSGRQADALAVFRDARAVLVDELGIEPRAELRDLEQAILRHDPALEAPARARRARAAADRRLGGALVTAGGLLLVAGAVLAIVIATGGDGDRDGGRLSEGGAGGRVLALDLASGDVTRTLGVSRTPGSIAVGDGKAWFIDGDARTLQRVDTQTGEIDTTSTGATPIDLALGDDVVWVVDGSPRAAAAAIGPVPEHLVGLDPATLRRRSSVPLPPGPQAVSPRGENTIAVTADSVWVVVADGSIVRVDPSSGAITGRTRVDATAIAAGPGGLWAVDRGRLIRIDSRTGRVMKRMRLSAPVDVLAVGDRAVFVSSFSDGRLWRVDPAEGSVPVSVEVGSGVGDLVVSPSAVWATNATAGTVTRVDPRTMTVTRIVRVGGVPRSLAVDGSRVWVASSGSGEAAESRVAGIKAVDAGSCAPPVTGRGGRADVLITSDLPLQGDTRLSAVQMEQAIVFTLREHGFRAGRFRVAYQSCDDALATTGMFDEARCAANGRAFASDPDVVGVVGSFNSGCAFFLLPELNRARGGPVAMVSPLNSYVGLTRAPPDIDLPDVLERMYPTGRRNFVRVYPADDVQAGALARVVRDRGLRRVFVLDDGEVGYSDLISDAFGAAAKRLGLDVVGRARWHRGPRSFRPLARRVAATRPDAVVVAGILNNDVASVVRDLRGVLGRKVLLLGPDGLGAPYELRGAAGPAANGVLISIPGVVTQRLPPAGARWLEGFRRTQPGVDVELFAVYAAQATEVLLDAIARSDGTRASVLSAVFATRLRDGITGGVAFDDAGDMKRVPETIIRVANTQRGTSIASIRGAVVERVINVGTPLVERRR